MSKLEHLKTVKLLILQNLSDLHRTMARLPDGEGELECNLRTSVAIALSKMEQAEIIVHLLIKEVEA